MSFSVNDLKLRLRQLCSDMDADADEIKAVVDGLFTQNQPRILQVPTDADGNFTVVYGDVLDKDITVTAVKFLTAGTITADGTNYTTLALNKYDGAGGSATIVASRATDTVTTDDVAAGVPWALTLSGTAANLDVDAGEVLGVTGVKASAGVAVPAGIIVVEYIPR